MVGKVQSQKDLESCRVRNSSFFVFLHHCADTTRRRARHLRLPAPSKKPLPSIQVANPYTRRTDFISRPASSKGRNDNADDEESDNSSAASAAPFGRAQSATSTTYISGRSVAPSVASASRYSLSRTRNTSPTRLQVPTSISIARARSAESRSGSPPPERKKGPSSVASADTPHRPWGFQRPTRPLFRPN